MVQGKKFTWFKAGEKNTTAWEWLYFTSLNLKIWKIRGDFQKEIQDYIKIIRRRISSVIMNQINSNSHERLKLNHWGNTKRTRLVEINKRKVIVQLFCPRNQRIIPFFYQINSSKKGIKYRGKQIKKQFLQCFKMICFSPSIIKQLPL